MFFPGKHAGLLYIIVSIKLHIGNYMYKCHYVCDALDYNTVSRWSFDDDTIAQYLEYPMNVYDDL